MKVIRRLHESFCFFLWLALKSAKQTCNRRYSILSFFKENKTWDRSKAVVPVLVLLFVALWFILRGDLLFFSPFSIAITSLGKERANLSAFRTFVRYVLV